MSITLSKPAQKYVAKQVAKLGLNEPEEFVEKVLQEDRQRKIDEYHWKLVQEALASGPPIPAEEFWKQIREHRERRRQERERQNNDLNS
jgi:hypothetical protein